MSMYDDTECVLLSKEAIAKRVKELGKTLCKEYEDKNPLLICILKGSLVFYADLIREMPIPLELDFMATSSYGNGASTSGEVRVVKDTDKSLDNRHIILVEDIIDTGLTLAYLKKMLNGRNPASLKICTLLDKPDRRKVAIEGDYVGFKIADNFVVGYGLDYNQKYRNMPDISILKPSVYGGK